MKEDNNVWLPVTVKTQEVIRHSEGLGAHQARDYYHYTTVDNEEVILYNRSTGAMKKFQDIINIEEK